MPAITASSVTPKSKPSTEKMVIAAIKALNERTGSSVQAIKKYIISNYGSIDEKNTNRSIKKYLRKAVGDCTLVQTRGTGAIGSFKLSDKVIKAKELERKKKDKKKTLAKAKKQIQLDEKEKIQKNTEKNTTSKNATKKSIKEPKLMVEAKSKKIKVVSKAKNVLLEENAEDEFIAADVENNNIMLKGTAKRKNPTTIKLVRKSINILNTAAQRKIKPANGKTEISVPTIVETENSPKLSAPAKVKTTSKRVVKTK